MRASISMCPTTSRSLKRSPSSSPISRVTSAIRTTCSTCWSTCATSGGSAAILTADHVLADLPKEGAVGLVFPEVGAPRLHRPLLKIDATRKLTVGPASYDSGGPDLGLLILAEHDAANLKARRTFYN